MGNNHSETSKPPDRAGCKILDGMPANGYSKSKVLCNTPYLTALFEKLSKKSVERESVSSDGDIRVTQQVFEDAFNGPLKVLGRLLFKHINRASQKERRSSIHLDEFLQVSTNVLGLISNHQQLGYYFDVFTEDCGYLTVESAYHMVQVCFSVSQAVAYLPADEPKNQIRLLRALASSMIGPKGKMDKTEFVEWCSKHMPHIFNGTHSFFVIRLSGSTFDDTEWHKRMSQDTYLAKANLSTASIAMIGQLDQGVTTLSYCMLWILTSSLPNLYVLEQKKAGLSKMSMVPNFLMSRLQMLIEQRAWCLLYNSDQDGLSINRFEHHVYSYKGPSVMFMVFGSNTYALATENEWRENNSYFGGENTVLIQLTPRFSIVDKGRIVFINHHTRGLFKGIQIGSDYKKPVIKIGEMNTVIHYGVEMELEGIEVWGCASSEIRDVQLRQKAWERKEVEKLHNRKVKLENWEDNPDRMLMNWVGINTNHHEKA